MRKCIIVMVAVVLVFIASAAFSSSINGMFEGYPIVRVVVNGVEIKSDIPGISFKGRTMLPIRAIAEAGGMDVSWDAATWTANLTTKGVAVQPEIKNVLTADGFTFKNTSFMSSNIGGSQIIGEVINNSGRSYGGAIFTLSMYGSDGRLLGTESIAISNIANGETKSWMTYSLDVKPEDVKRYKFQFDMGY